VKNLLIAPNRTYSRLTAFYCKFDDFISGRLTEEEEVNFLRSSIPYLFKRLPEIILNPTKGHDEETRHLALEFLDELIDFRNFPSSADI